MKSPVPAKGALSAPPRAATARSRTATSAADQDGPEAVDAGGLPSGRASTVDLDEGPRPSARAVAAELVKFMRSARPSQLVGLQRNLARRTQRRALGAQGATPALQYGPLGTDVYERPEQVHAQAGLTFQLGFERGHPIAHYVLARWART